MKMTLEKPLKLTKTVPDVMGAILSEKQKRFLSAIFLIGLSLTLLYLGGPYFLAASFLIMIGLLNEWFRLFSLSLQPLTFLGLICLYLGFNGLFPSYQLGISVLGLLLILQRTIALSSKKPLFIIGLLYILLSFFSFTFLLDHFGFKLILWLLLIVWTADTSAYFVGSLLKGPKLIPQVSPNKTWSGFFGGIILPLTLGIPLGYYLQVDKFFNYIPLLTFFLILTAHGGDLLESWVKRLIGVKDSGQIIPGHGGLLDRLDSLLAASLLLGVLRLL